MILFHGGNVFTAGMARSAASDLVVGDDGRILALGAPGTLDRLLADDTDQADGTDVERIDTTGRLLIPGFVDAHVHPIQAGVELLQCELSEATDAASALALIAAYARAHADDDWILGGGWAMEWFPGGTPTAAALDAVVGGRPVALSNRDHHGVWVSSEALRRAGITRDTPDPVDGRIERDAFGEPTGTLHEGAATLIDHVRPAVDDELAYRGLLTAQGVLHRVGVTGWQDAMVGGYIEPTDGLAAYRRALREGTLTGRVTGALWWHRDALVARVAELARIRAAVAVGDAANPPADPERLAMSAVKIMVDGVAENFTAALSQPYRDKHGHPTGNAGLSFVDPDRLRTIVTALDAAGFDVHFHTLGDRAVTEALDAIEAARAAGGTGSRHHLAHLQMVGVTDITRFAALDATANLQALWASHEPQLDELTLPFLAPGLAERQYPFGELVRAGARLAAGSDWPVSSPNPLEAIQVAVTRMADGAPAGTQPLGGDVQRLSLAQALTAYTAGSARVNRRETTTGRLAAGAWADLALLDRDPFDHPADEIGHTRVQGTWVAGARVATADAPAGPTLEP